MERAKGLEPSTFSLATRRSTLSYARKLQESIINLFTNVNRAILKALSNILLQIDSSNLLIL